MADHLQDSPPDQQHDIEQCSSTSVLSGDIKHGGIEELVYSRTDNHNQNGFNVRISTSTPSSSLPSRRPSETEHLGKHRQYWRDMILGVNDGLVSTFLLVAGVVGGGLSSMNVLLTAISGAIAGAISMGAGEYIATKSQNQVLFGEVALERLHIQKYRHDELLELSNLFDMIGVPPSSPTSSDERPNDIRQQLHDHYEHNPDALLKIMTTLEFGIVQDEIRSPALAGITSASVFVLGSLPSVIPFCFGSDNNGNGGDEEQDYDSNTTVQLIISSVITCFALALVGSIKSWATRGNCLSSSLENLLVACVGGGLAYGIGVLFDSIIRQ